MRFDHGSGFRPSPSEASDQILVQSSLRQDVRVRLMRAILLGGIPAGTRLVALKIAQKFGISQTPVREALLELEAAGIVSFVHNRGAVVKSIQKKEIEEIYYVRRLFEREAVRNAWGKIPVPKLLKLKSLTQSLLEETDKESSEWIEKSLDADRQLHELVLSCCGNNRLAEETRRCFVLIDTIRVAVAYESESQKQALTEHLRILDALLNGTCEESVNAMDAHICRTVESVNSVLFQAAEQVAGE